MGGCSHLKRAVLEFDGINQHIVIEEKKLKNLRKVVVRLLFRATILAEREMNVLYISCFTISLLST